MNLISSLGERMKGGFHGLRAKQILLTLLIFASVLLLIWAWDRNAFLTSFLPLQIQLLRPSPDILLGAPVVTSIPFEPDVNAKKYLSPVASNRNVASEQKEKPSDVVMPTVPSEGTTPKTENQDKSISSNDRKKVIGSPEKEMLHEENLGSETKPGIEKKVSDTGATSAFAPLVSEKIENDSSIMAAAKKKACNYAKGKWMEDSRRPLYSGFGCKQWLSEMWACRLTQRTDFSYETFRWVPHGCQIPDFDGSSFLRRMQDKTIAFIGDSLGRQQFQSLMCMVTGGVERPDVLDVGREYGLVKARGAIRPDGWAYRFPSTNTTILYYWSASLCDLEPINITNPTTDWAMHLDRPPAFLRRYLHMFDVLVLNTGHHWNRGKINANRWVMYVGGIRNTDRRLTEITKAKNLTVYSIVKWLDSELPKYPKLKAFFRTISPRHFFNGDWNTGGSCDNTTPLAGGKEVTRDDSSDPLASRAVKGTKVKLLDITAISQLRDEAHMSRYSIRGTPGTQDCLHWCLPGVPDTWNEILAAQL
ncbi:hypothetical protein Syun_023479 [Stephania yunnanensis]|uniref:Trichome birefringence-like N-terminal domain-containing protein n=1 Tax=Stephania yunnanensis TaxID=152371 RepID=A0AAP0FN05_9MAGN